MDSKQNFVFYLSWMNVIDEEYEDEQIKKDLVYSIVRYGLLGEKQFPCERLFLKQAFAQIDSAKEIWSARVEAGRKGGLKGKGGAPRGNQNASKQKQTKANNTKTKHNENENENVNDNTHSHTPHSSEYSNDSASLQTLEELEASGVLAPERKRGMWD